MWPRLQGIPSRAPADGRRARAARPAQVHDWAFCAGFWRCNSCLQTSGAPSLRSVCRGLPRPFRRAIAEPRGHFLSALPTEGGAMVVICNRCAAWSGGRQLRNLAKQCPGDVAASSTPGKGAAARDALKRVASGRHPDPSKPGLRLCVRGSFALLAVCRNKALGC